MCRTQYVLLILLSPNHKGDSRSSRFKLSDEWWNEWTWCWAESGVLVSEVLGQIWSPCPQPNLENAVCVLASLSTTFLPPRAQSPSLNPRVTGSKRGLYSGTQPITQSHAVLGHLSIIQVLKGLSLLPCQKPCFCAHLASCDLPYSITLTCLPYKVMNLSQCLAYDRHPKECFLTKS